MTREEIIEALTEAETKANEIGELYGKLKKEFDEATNKVLNLRKKLYDIDHPTCNVCDYARPCGLPEGVLCTEEHHQEGKDKWQYCAHTCEYCKSSGKVRIY